MHRKDIIHLVLALLFVGISINLSRTTIGILKNTGRLRDLEVEVAHLEKKKEEIESSIEYKKTDEYVEGFARNELNMVKPGEEVFVVVKGDNLSSDLLGSEEINTGDNKMKDDKSNFAKWIALFFE